MKKKQRFFQAAQILGSSVNATVTDQARLPLRHALRVKSAEFWLQLGEEAQARAELDRLLERARNHRCALKVLLSVMRTIGERTEKIPHV